MAPARGFVTLMVVALSAIITFPVAAGTWTETTGNMVVGRRYHTATLLADSKVLVAGGEKKSGWFKLTSNDVELYDPATGRWTVTGRMNTARKNHTATLLPNGKVLVAGGESSGSAELYDPATGSWSETDTMNRARENHTATLLRDGRVLVAGGTFGSGFINVISDSAELYDPATESWTETGTMNTARVHHTATLLPNGKLLVAGGESSGTAELFDPETGSWSETGTMNKARDNHAATLLPDGKVLVSGGSSGNGSTEYLSSAELFDPTTGSWTETGTMNSTGENHTATLLPDGRVLVSGGHQASLYFKSTSRRAELYDPATGSWTETGEMNTARGHHTATLLADGRVLVAGGFNNLGSVYQNSAELFDPTEGYAGWSASGHMNTGRYQHTATVLAGGSTLVSGGSDYDDDTVYLSSAELFDANSGTWSDTGPMNTARGNHTGILLADGRVLVAGGYNSDSGGSLSSAEVYDPGTGGWTETATMNSGRSGHTATLLANGRVLVAGGYETDSGGVLSSAEVYDAATGNWIETGNLDTARSSHAATLLADGRVLVVGGHSSDYGGYLSEAEVYDPVSGSWSRTDNLSFARRYHTATLLPDGKVLVVGGTGNDGLRLNSTELYDPVTGSWSNSGNLDTARSSHTATLIPDGKVLVIGGSDESQDELSSAEIYDPATGDWTEAENLNMARTGHTATLLPDGRVLVAGGGARHISGVPFYSGLNTVEIYDRGLGFDPAWRPALDTIGSTLEVGYDAVQLSGSGFFGISEASSGNTRNSSTNYPLVHIRRIEGAQSRWLLPDPNTNFSDTSYTSLPLADFPDGHALVTVFANGIPSESKTILIDNPPVVRSITPGQASPTNEGSVEFIVTFSKGVSGVDASDFSPYESGVLSGSSVSAISGSGSNYTVTVAGYSNQGALRLDLTDDDTIQDGFGFPLGGTGTENGDYTQGGSYDIDLIAPFLAYAAVQLDGLSVDVTFSEPMGAGAELSSNYTVSGDGRGTLSPNPDSVVQYGSTYRLIWNSGEMVEGGDITITATNIEDAVGNSIDAPNSSTDLDGGIGAAPTTAVSPGGGTYDAPQTVSFSCDDGSGSGCAATYYSTDGSDPSIAYTGPFVIDRYTELKFYSADKAENTEAVQTKVYHIDMPSTISCVLSTGHITLGESFSVSGQISPAPNEAGRGVDIALTPSGGETVHLSAIADVNGLFAYDVSCSDLTGAGTWTAQTSWAGDASHLGSSSSGVSLVVAQAGSSLNLDIVMSEAIKINSEPPIGGNFSPAPFCSTSNLTGTPITLRITDPDSTEHLVVANTNQHGQFLLDYSATGFAFNKLGNWSIAAEFADSNDYAPAASETITVRVVPTAGYAVIIQGATASGEGLASHIKTTNFVYDKLIERQLLHDDIEYFGWDVLNPNWDALPFKAAIETAITQTVKDKMITNAGDLYIIMVNHGWTEAEDTDEGVFYTYPDDPITSTDLKGWLDSLQNALVGTAAEDRQIIVMLGFCRAGAFMDDIYGVNRIAIASAAADEYSHRGPQDVDENGEPLREGEYFVAEFFKSVSYGKSVSRCFEDATTLTETFAATGSGNVNAPYFDDSAQHPLLDDNWDGVGSNELSGDPGEDGHRSQFLFIGTSPPTGNDPGDVRVTEVAEAQFLETGDTAVDVWARVDEPNDVRIIWAEVKGPDYDPGDPGAGVQIEMETFKKPTVEFHNGRFEWSSLGGGSDPAELFSTPGTYQVFYFAKDDNTGHVSPLFETKVYKARPGNLPPLAFSLVSPANGETHLTTLVLDWSDSADPDRDRLSYTVLLSRGDPSFSHPIRKEGLQYSSCLASPADGIEDLSTYYWKVQAIDECGAVRESEVRVFHTDNTNPVAAWLSGHVYNAATGESIITAVVSVGGLDLPTELAGYYLGQIPPGTYTITASANGYNSKSYHGVVIADAAMVTKDFALVMSGDSDGDEIPDGWEEQHGLNSSADDASEDPDHDGLDNLDEFLNQTDPTTWDTDNDGMPDGWETECYLNPLVDDARADADGDGCSNLLEYLRGTAPGDANSHPPRVMPWLPLLLGD